ncbi:hypothetical protein AYI69_g3477 [Smittium culicis]|uniref:Uncharacterized protein n=1 Tax=Smittium culicis TaxID=133412 RepID=A0A1R1YJK3_9FUNG|nr:hypothetical protein AYI69_g3477 [Smittium culicis]
MSTILSKQMSLYSISEYDLHPWIVPKYGSFCKFICCFASNYTSVDTAEYLYFVSCKNLFNIQNLNTKPLL